MLIICVYNNLKYFLLLIDKIIYKNLSTFILLIPCHAKDFKSKFQERIAY